jgi:flagellar basal-body rod protein FlgG
MNGLYIGSMGMINYQQHLNVHANNIANAQTIGFKVDQMTSKVYASEKAYRSDSNGRTPIGTIEHSVVPNAVHVNLVPGSMKVTNSSTDFYLEDAPGQTSFFVVGKNDTQYLTRNGNFSVNEEGYLQTSGNAYVLDVNGDRIRMETGVDITVDTQGKLVNARTGTVIATLQTRLVNEEAANRLERHAFEMFTVQDININELPQGTAKVYNYMLENSNTDMTKEMSSLMVNQRMVQASQRVMQSFDKVYEKEANELLK